MACYLKIQDPDGNDNYAILDADERTDRRVLSVLREQAHKIVPLTKAAFDAQFETEFGRVEE